MLGRRRPRRQAHRLPQGRPGEGGRDSGLLLDRMARQGDPRRRDEQNGRAHEERRSVQSGEEPDALRRQAANLRRIRTGRRALAPWPLTRVFIVTGRHAAIRIQSSYRWVIVAAGGLLGCVAIGAMFSLPVFLLPISQETGWSVTGVSSAMTIGFLALAVASMLWGALSDRWG